jgi:D-glycero-D-manno-heptose 1,7-bisphosphate phosphatase
MASQQKMIILDRDGVINQDSDDYIKSADEWIPIKGSLEAIARIKKAGYLVTVATNQSGIGRGMFSQQALQAMHDKFTGLLAQRGVEIDGIFYCPHKPTDNCLCRKPKPGLLLQIAQQFDIDLKTSVFVGDSFSDMQAARLVGAIPALVQTGKGMRTIEKHGFFEDTRVYTDLAHFARELIRGSEA